MITEERVRETLSELESLQQDVLQFTADKVTTARGSVKENCKLISQETAVRLSVQETALVRSSAIVAFDAEYHLLRAYFHASPSLILILGVIWGFISTVIEIINVINSILKLITSETLAYWLDKIMPGFQTAWENIMRKVSEFSSALGWGVDGVSHLLNICDTGADLWSTVTGKERGAASLEKYKRFEKLTGLFSKELSACQDNPGAWITGKADYFSSLQYGETAGTMLAISTNIKRFGTKFEDIAKDMGNITNEILSLRNDMPGFIAKNIPQALWDAVGWADTMINDRLLPRLDDLFDRLSELDAVLEAQRKKAEALADKIAHPGDLLAEIDKLPDYARKEQLGKIDSVTSQLIREQNEAEYAAIEGDLREFARVAEALSHGPAPLPFMELELPGRSPGITPEPRETWFVGDY